MALAPWKSGTAVGTPCRAHGALRRRAAGLAATVLALAAHGVHAQSPLRPAVDPPPPPGSPPWIVQAGPEYDAGPFKRWWLGRGYRDLWTTPVTAPVLDLRKEAGGLEPIRVGGGFQTQTIHFRGADDGYYLFRSVNKAVRNSLEPDLQDTPGGWLVQEQTSSMHPAGGWVVPPLLEAVGVPQSHPKLFIMPDDPILGEHRERFAGVLGMLVESPDKGESGKKRFQGSDDIAGSPDFLEEIEARPSARVEARMLLASRLVDLIAGDPDRNFDNFRWIAYDSAQSRVWKPVPMDRDPAFLRAGGVVPWLVRETFLPKLVKFGPEYEDVRGLWVSQPEVDRLLLAELDRRTWDSVTTAVQTALTDDVIDRAVARMPKEYLPVGGDFLESSMKARRDHLRQVVDRFYRELAKEVDVQATSAADVAEVAHGADGSVEVALYAECQLPRLAAQNQDSDPITCSRTYYRRRFDPAETDEVRVYLRAGDDQALVRGVGPQRITVRVIGGPGNDRLQDSAQPDGGSRTVFYDHEGDNQVLGENARLVSQPWERRVITDFITNDTKDSTYVDFGHKKTWKPLADYDKSAGVIVGLRRRMTDYGFRRDPWAQQLDLSFLVGLQGGFGGEVARRWRLEASDVVVSAHAAYGRDLWSYRFYGYGNDTPEIDSDLALVPADQTRVGVDVEFPIGRDAWVTIGPDFRYLWPDPEPDGPLAEQGFLGSDDFGQAGLLGRIELSRVDDDVFPRLGFDVRGEATAYAPLQGDSDPFGGGFAEARGYLPMPLRSALALRVGAGAAWGDVPAHDAIFLGGRRSLRGFHGDRFAGDGSVYGSSELRVPLGQVTLITRGRVGAIGFADAGRVYVGSDSPGGWHTAYGGGIWYSTMGLTGSLLYAQGEQGRVHAYFGLPF